MKRAQQIGHLPNLDNRRGMVQEMTFADTGETAAILNHHVTSSEASSGSVTNNSDGKLIVNMRCKDISTTAVYVRQ